LAQDCDSVVAVIACSRGSQRILTVSPFVHPGIVGKAFQNRAELIILNCQDAYVYYRLSH